MIRNFFLVSLWLLVLVPLSANAAIAPTAGDQCGPSSSTLCSPVQVPGVDTVPDFLKYVMTFVGGLIGFIAIATIVYGGIRMITANGNDKVITDAKNVIVYTIVGFGASVLAYAGVLSILTFLGVKSTRPEDPNTVFNPFGNLSLQTFAASILANIIKISGLIALVMLIWYGFRYLTARGDEGQTKKAKTGILWTLVGLVVIISAYIIVSATANLLR